MAAVKVVLPWSMCPMVPMFTCGLLRSNFSFAILRLSSLLLRDSLYPAHDFFGQRGRYFFIFAEMHRKTAAALVTRAEFGGITEHLRKRHRRLDDLGRA